MKHVWIPAAVLEAIYVWIARTPDFRGNLLLFFALTISGALASLFFARRSRLRGALLFGLLFRVTLVLRPPDLSDDLYRYAFDGELGRAGISAYAFTPDDPALAKFRGTDWARMAHRDARTVYPPGAQIVFKFGASTHNAKRTLKILFAAADLAVVWLLSRFPGGAFASGLYAAFPLPVFESAASGHLDSLAVALLLAALLHLRARKNLQSGVALAASVLVKYFAGFALLPFLRRGRIALPFAAAASVIWLAGAGPRGDPTAGLANFVTRWEGNSVIYPAVERGVAIFRLAERAKASYAEWKSHRPQKPWMERVWPYFYPEFFARAILALCLAVGLFTIAIRIDDPVEASAASLALFLLASPVLHPWYLLWILPFAALYRNAAFLYLSACVPLAYALLFPTPFFSKPVVLAFEYVPFFALLVWDLRRVRKGMAS
jgi:hypothetical protein